MRGNKFTHSKASSKVKSNQGRALSGSENHVLLAARVSIHRESWLQTETRPGASFQLEHLVQHHLCFRQPLLSFFRGSFFHGAWLGTQSGFCLSGHFAGSNSLWTRNHQSLLSYRVNVDRERPVQ